MHPLSKCKYFCWADASPSVSPITMQGPMASIPTALKVHHLTTTGEVTCIHLGCQTSWLAPNCANRQCHHHCIPIGSCQNVKTHAGHGPGWAVIPSAIDPLENGFFSSHGYAPLVPSDVLQPSQALTSALSLPPSTAPCLWSLDPQPNPCYSFQMMNIFTEQWSVQQSLAALKREQAECLENSRRGSMEVTVHAQVKVCALISHVLLSMLTQNY